MFGIAGIGTVFNNASMNLTKSYGNSSQITTQQTSHDVNEKTFNSFAAGTMFSLFVYIAGIVLTFVVKNVKAIGIVLIVVIGIIPITITNGWGIIPFALLLPAGIVAIRQGRNKQKQSTITN